MNSDKPYFRIIKSYSKKSIPFETDVFNQIDFIECHEDGTIIFQAPNCEKQSVLKDEIYFVAYSPKGEKHIREKRNIGELTKIDKRWFKGTHIKSISN